VCLMVQKLWYIRTRKQTSISSPKKQVGCFSQKNCDTIHTPREILNSYPLIPYIFKTDRKSHELIYEVNLHAALLCVGYT